MTARLLTLSVKAEKEKCVRRALGLLAAPVAVGAASPLGGGSTTERHGPRRLHE